MAEQILVIFDCDGTLIDSEIISVKVDQRVLADHGWHLPLDEVFQRFTGCSDAFFTAELEKFLGNPLKSNWKESYKQWYTEAFERELTLVEGINDALDSISMTTCVASNSRHARLNQTLGMTGLLNRFQGRIFSSEDVSQGKPAPDLFLHAAKTMGYAPNQCIVVEDSRFGVQAARAAGMQVLGYFGGLTPREWLEGPQTTVFNKMSELPKLVSSAFRQNP